MTDHGELDRLAGRQLGLLTTHQMLAAGMTHRQIAYAVTTGRLHRVRRSTYRTAGSPRTWEQALRAATLAADCDAWVSHASAAALWQIAGIAPPERIHLLTRVPDRVRLPGVDGHRTTELPPSHVGQRRGVPVTSAARTLIDVAGQLRGARLAVAADDLRRQKLLTLSDLACTLAEVPVSGRRVRRPIVSYLNSTEVHPGGSEAELDVIRAIRAAGLPLPAQQWRVSLPGGRRVYLDFAYPDVMEALEFMGFDPHGAFVSRFHADAGRVRQLQERGWRIWPITAWTTRAELLSVVRGIAQRLEATRIARPA